MKMSWNCKNLYISISIARFLKIIQGSTLLEESIEKNSLNKYCNAYNNLSQMCRDYLHIQSANRKP